MGTLVGSIVLGLAFMGITASLEDIAWSPRKPPSRPVAGRKGPERVPLAPEVPEPVERHYPPTARNYYSDKLHDFAGGPYI